MTSGTFVFGDGTGVTECAETLLDDIEEIWRVDSRFLADDDFVALWATIEGDQETVDIYRADPEPGVVLADELTWGMNVWKRGPGFCWASHYGTPGGQGAGGGCQVWTDSDVMLPLVSGSLNEDGGWLRGEVLGLVSDEVDRVVINFEQGEPAELDTTDQSHLGLRAFGLPFFFGSEKGDITTIEAYSGGALLATWSHALGEFIEE